MNPVAIPAQSNRIVVNSHADTIEKTNEIERAESRHDLALREQVAQSDATDGRRRFMAKLNNEPISDDFSERPRLIAEQARSEQTWIAAREQRAIEILISNREEADLADKRCSVKENELAAHNADVAQICARFKQKEGVDCVAITSTLLAPNKGLATDLRAVQAPRSLMIAFEIQGLRAAAIGLRNKKVAKHFEYEGPWSVEQTILTELERAIFSDAYRIGPPLVDITLWIKARAVEIAKATAKRQGAGLALRWRFGIEWDGQRLTGSAWAEYADDQEPGFGEKVIQLREPARWPLSAA
jgi:hypothetical protein